MTQSAAMRLQSLFGLLLLTCTQLPAASCQRGLIDDLAGIAWNRKFGHLQNEQQSKYKELIDGTVGVAKSDPEKGVDSMDPDGRTPLHWAAANGYDEMVAALVNAGAEVDSGCLFADQSPLFLACRWGRLSTVEFLLEQGADLNRADKFGRTPSSAARQSGNRELARLLAERGE